MGFYTAWVGCGYERELEWLGHMMLQTNHWASKYTDLYWKSTGLAEITEYSDSEISWHVYDMPSLNFYSSWTNVMYFKTLTLGVNFQAFA